ncbi:hypothetical protein ANTQUA_LOCUS5822 [Anthophora quadrimaculata]
MFSYKAQVDDAMDEDTVSLPHQQSFSSLKTDSDYIYQVHTPSTYMPLYDSQMVKTSSPLKHKTSLHSLTSIRDTKSGSGHIYDSPTVLYRSMSGIKSTARRFSVEKTATDLKSYPLTKSDNFIGSKNSSPDLRFPGATWKSRSTSQFKYGGPSSVTNLLFSPSTASNFLYKPGANNSNSNLFSLTRKSSLEYARKRSEENMAGQFIEIPPFENTLQSILDSSINESEMRHSISAHEPLMKTATVAETLETVERKETSPSKQYTDTELSEIDAEDATDVSNVTEQLLLKPTLTSDETSKKRKKRDTKKKESGGLSDYLLSLTTSTSARKVEKPETDPSLSPLSHRTKSYTQTESL